MERNLMALILLRCSRKLVEIIDIQNNSTKIDYEVFNSIAYSITMMNMIAEELDPKCFQEAIQENLN